MCSRAVFVLAVSVYAGATFAQQRQDGLFVRDAVGAKSYQTAPHVAQLIGAEPAIVLAPAIENAPEEIDRLRDWNRSGREPVRNGFVRPLPDAIEVRVPATPQTTQASRFERGALATANNGDVTYGTSIKVEGAERLRLRLDDAVLPEGSTVWVYGPIGSPIAFGSELAYNGTIWTPAVDGPQVYVDVEVPKGAGAASFKIAAALELLSDLQLGIAKPFDSPTCLEDAKCITTSKFDSLDFSKRAIAQLQFVTAEGSFVCTGALLNDRNSTGTPYLLTAHHCFSTQAEASTLDLYWDFATNSCNGTYNRATSPHTAGSTLLLTSTTSDFTFVRLNSIPSGRYLLGWDPRTSAVASGTRLHRISHPAPSTILPQMYSNTFVNTGVGTCTSLPRGNFIYSTAGEGGTYGGSSGSPAIIDGGYVVGQLFGACGLTPQDGCTGANSTVDGAFSITYTAIQQYLEAPITTACVENSTTMCLVNGRFAVSASWQTHDASGQGTAVRLTTDTGYFWFFGANNVEAVIKVLDACGFSSRYWVFAGGLTNVRVVLTVRDSKTGSVKTYTNPIDTAFQPIQDTSAFATCQ